MSLRVRPAAASVRPSARTDSSAEDCWSKRVSVLPTKSLRWLHASNFPQLGASCCFVQKAAPGWRAKPNEPHSTRSHLCHLKSLESWPVKFYSSCFLLQWPVILLDS